MRKYKIIMLLLSVVILLGIVVYANPIVLVGLWLKSNYLFLAAGFCAGFVALLLGVLKWKVLMKDVGFVELFPVQVLGFTISNFTPGKAAEPAKAVILKMVKGTPISSSLASIIWERVSDVFSLILLSAVAISSLSVTSNFFVAGAISLLVFAAIIIVSFSVLYSRRFGVWLFKFVRRFPVLRKLPGNFMELFYKVTISRKRLFSAFALAIITWLLEGVVMYFALGAFGVYLNPLVLAGIVALAVVIGIASSLPGGLGTTEVVMVFLLGLQGVEGTIAVAAAITFRFMTIWMVNFLGGLCFVHLSRKFDVKSVF